MAAMKQQLWRRTLVVCVLATGLLALATPGAGAITAKQLANKVLKVEPRKPADIDLFTSEFSNGAQGAYPNGSEMKPASGRDLTETEVRRQLAKYLRGQFKKARAVNSALKLFDSQRAETMVPDPTLRAAVVGMRSTLLQPTINNFLGTDKFEPMRYGPLPGVDAIANVRGASTQRRMLSVNDRYEREDFRYLVGVMGHEFLHDDAELRRAEEVVLNGLSGMTYLQVLRTDPQLAHTGTELSRQMNTLALLFLNSRERRSPNSELYAPTGTGVFPGGPHQFPDVWTAYGGDAATSPAPRALAQVARGVGLRGASNFSLATAKKFSGVDDKWLSDVGRVQISVLLQMVSVQEIAKISGLGRSEVKRKLRLGPYLDAIK